MAVNTLPRDYDLARIIDDYERRIAFLERQALISPVALSIWRDAPGGFDTGWQPITSWDSDFAPQPPGADGPVVRRWGPIVHTKGRANTTVDSVSGTRVYTLPTGFGFEPSTIHEAGRSLVPGSGNAAHRYYVDTGGDGNQQGMSALSISSGALVSISTTWMVELP